MADTAQAGVDLSQELVAETLDLLWRLPANERANVLGFVHLVEDPRTIRTALEIDPSGRVTLRLEARELGLMPAPDSPS